MNERKVLIAITALLLLAGALTAAFMAGRGGADHAAATAGPAEEKKQLWTCGMHPWIVEEEPGQCPICGMDLVPKTDDGGAVESGIRIDPETVQNMGLRTAAAERRRLVRAVRTWGHVTYDESRVRRVSPKTAGWIEEAVVESAGALVKKGDLLARIYSPAVLAAQEEYLASAGAMREAARRRLLYWDVPAETIRRLDETGRTMKAVPLLAPADGVVTRTGATAGAAVKPGAALYEISDVSRVWVDAHVFEYELPWVRTGQEAVITLPYRPGARFTGRVSHVYPYMERKTRDLVARIELDNPGMVLKPDMYADIEIMSDSGRTGVVVPSEAVLRDGDGSLVFVAAGPGRFVPRRVKIGLTAAGGMVEIAAGVEAGETVVVSGQFLLDSESRLKEAVAKMLAPEKAAGPAGGGEDDFFSDM